MPRESAFQVETICDVPVLAGDGIAASQFLEAGLWMSSLVFATIGTYYYREEILEQISGSEG